MNTLFVAIPVWSGDYQTVMENLRQQFERDGKCRHSAVVFLDGCDVKGSAIRDLAERCFQKVERFSFPASEPRPWPFAQNRVWQNIARWFEANGSEKHSGWFMWESDALPLKKGWLDILADAYVKGGKPFMGHIVPQRNHMNAVAVYPFNISDYCVKAMLVKASPFDIALTEEVTLKRITMANHLIAHHLKERGGDPAKPIRQTIIDSLPETTVLIHGYYYDKSKLHTELDESLPYSCFYHSGDLGDIIYSLPAVRELGGGEMVLGPDNRTNMATREKMTPDRYKLIAPLLEAQGYIRSTRFAESIPNQCSHDLNQMRLLLRSKKFDLRSGSNLARCYLEMVKLDLNNDQSPWLTVEPVKKARVIINRSSRYRDPAFRWDIAMREYRGEMAFIGLKSEHSEFQLRYGPIPFLPTNDLMEAAQFIAGSDLFIGNQSCCYAIAEGLKKTAILEACPTGSNTIFDRKSVTVGLTESTPLPMSVGTNKQNRVKVKDEITIAGPVDYFTGLGRCTCQLIEGCVKKGITPLIIESSKSTRVPLPNVVSEHLGNISGSGPRILISPLLDVPSRITLGDTVLTMWESTRLPMDSVDALNRYASLVIVPSRWCASVFSANGVTAPIKIVPLGVDTEIYKPSGTPVKGIVIGAAGRLAHGGKRKGIEDVITAFRMAFPKGWDAKLKLKLFDDCYIPPFKDKRISVETSNLTDQQMAEWYNSLTCFVSLAKGEGWGLHVHEAMACGINVIAPAFSGLEELVMPLLKFSIVDASEGYSGHWCQPNIEHAAEFMKNQSGIMWIEPISTVNNFVTGVLEAMK